MIHVVSARFFSSKHRPARERTRYSRLARFNHWLAAMLMFALVVSGLAAHYLEKGALRDLLLDYGHKPVGLLMIVLTLVRLATSTRPSARPHHSHGLARWEIVAAWIGHAALYALLLLIPLSGVMMSQGAGKPIMFFGLFTLPQLLPIGPGLAPPEQYWFRLGNLLHTNVLEWAFYIVFAAHIAGVFKHQFVDGDRAFIRRMWGFWGT